MANKDKATDEIQMISLSDKTADKSVLFILLCTCKFFTYPSLLSIPPMRISAHLLQINIRKHN